jgi:nucleoside-diphosphate-sugar epimerase
MYRIAVSGATGMIGSALIRRCIGRGVEVVALINPGSKKNDNIPVSPLVTLVPCGLEDMAAFDAANIPPCDVFYHFAWAGTYGASRNDGYQQNRNITYALDAVGLAHRLGCEAFIGAGSQAEYGRVEGKLSAETPVFPENSYGIAKLCAGQLTRIHAHQLGLRHIWTRILSVYGIGDNNFTVLISTLEKILNKEQPAFTKGEQQWDYLYCDDAANAFYLLGLYGKDNAVYPIGSGTSRRLRDFFETACRMCDENVKPDFGALPYNENQVMYLCADIAALQRDTGFTPTVPFEEGIARTIAWYEEKRQK